MNAPLPTAAPPTTTKRRPRFQFNLLGLFVLMLAASMIGALIYYFLRGLEGQTDMKLIGMIAILAGPLLLTIAISLFVSAAQWLGRR